MKTLTEVQIDCRPISLIEKIERAIASAKDGTPVTVVSTDDPDDQYINELWATGDRAGVVQWLEMWRSTAIAKAKGEKRPG